VPEENLDFTVQGKINRGRHTDYPSGCHSIRINQCLPPASPIFFTGQMPLLPPNQQCQSTEGIICLQCLCYNPALDMYNICEYNKCVHSCVQAWSLQH